MKTPISLSIVERQILINQFRILSALNTNESYDKSIAILEDGIEFFYNDVIQLSEPVGDDIVLETMNILNMYDTIEESRSRIPNLVIPENLNHLVSFLGFDMNSDKHYLVARTLVKKLEKWKQYAGRDLNSHSPGSLVAYKKMIAVYNEKGYFGRHALLSERELIELLNAGIA